MEQKYYYSTSKYINILEKKINLIYLNSSLHFPQSTHPRKDVLWSTKDNRKYFYIPWINF